MSLHEVEVEVNSGGEPLPPCKWYVSFDQPECGKPAQFKAILKSPVASATVDLCSDHKKIHDEKWARRRTTISHPAK